MSVFVFYGNLKKYSTYLTDGIFETGAYAVCTNKSQNSTVLGQGGSSKVWILKEVTSEKCNSE